MLRKAEAEFENGNYDISVQILDQQAGTLSSYPEIYYLRAKCAQKRGFLE